MLKQSSRYHPYSLQPQIDNQMLLESTTELSPLRQDKQRTIDSTADKAEKIGVVTRQQHDRSEVVSKSKPRQQSKWCILHNKELQIYCMTDRIKICAHCALFSTHRQHQLIPAKQITQIITSLIEQYNQCRQRKLKLDDKLKSTAFRQAMVATITSHKNSLIGQIKQKFRQLYQNIKLAQKRAYDEVAKSFKHIMQEITLLDKQQQHANLMYQKWELACMQMLGNTSYEQKVYLLGAGNLSILKDGATMIGGMEERAESKIQCIERMVKSIKIQQNRAIPNSIFNYVSVVIDQHKTIPQSSIKPQPMNNNIEMEQAEQIIQVNSAKIIRQPPSPHSHSPKKRGSSATQTNNLRKSVNRKPSKTQQPTSVQLQTIVSQFCSKQNLQTLDLTNCGLLDAQIIHLLDYLKGKKKVKALKLSKNKLTAQGFNKLLQLIPSVTNLNLSSNQLSQQSVYQLLRKRPKIPQLRIVNLSSNSINERRCQTAIEQLKKQGVIVTI